MIRRILHTPELIAELRAWNAANKRARDEYRQHPNSHWGRHGYQCAAEGCKWAAGRKRGAA